MKEYVFTLFGRRHATRRKTPEGRHIFTLTNGDAVHTPRRKTPEGRNIFTLYGRRHAARRKTPEGRHIFTLYKRRHRSHTAAEMSDSGYNSTLCKHHPIKQKKRRMTACPPIPSKNLRRPLITPKNTAIFIGFFFDTSPGYAAESPCFRHKHTPSARNTFLPLA